MNINGIEIRKFATFIEEIFHEGGPVASKPLKMGAIAAPQLSPMQAIRSFAMSGRVSR